MQRCNPCRLALLMAALVPAAAAAEKPLLDPGLAYQATRSDPIVYDVDYEVVVTAPYHTKTLRVWLPLPPSDAGQEVTERSLTTFPQEVEPQIAAEAEFGNRFAYFEFDHPQGAQIIRHKFQIKVWELRWQLDPARVMAVARWPQGFDRYLKPDRAVEIDERFKNLLGEIIPQRGGPAADLAVVLNWTKQNLKYDHHEASLRASSAHALEKRRGHCSDYHGFCAALGRVLGHPTRVTYGINAFPKNSPSHCKLEAFLPPYGWVSFDVSETQRLIDKIHKAEELSGDEKDRFSSAATARLLSGFRDNTWFVQTRGTDYQLAPPAAERVNVVRTIYAEADGQALPDPDPADPQQRTFSWMTAQRFTADRKVPYPFGDWRTLE